MCTCQQRSPLAVRPRRRGEDELEVGLEYAFEQQLEHELDQEAFLTLLRPVGHAVAAEAERLARYLSTQSYGCFCGPGSKAGCRQPLNPLDECCRLHDMAYAHVGVTGATPAHPAVSMWTPQGFLRTRTADLALAACARRTLFDRYFYGPAAAVYREALIQIFNRRAAISDKLAIFPPCVRNNTTDPLWRVDAILGRC